jgi:hypothetical protein
MACAQTSPQALRASDLMAASAAAGDLQTLRLMSFVLGPPHEHVAQYERALVSACDAGHVHVAKTLLAMGVTPLDGHAADCASRGGHIDVVKLLHAVGSTVSREETKATVLVLRQSNGAVC